MAVDAAPGEGGYPESGEMEESEGREGVWVGVTACSYQPVE